MSDTIRVELPGGQLVDVDMRASEDAAAFMSLYLDSHVSPEVFAVAVATFEQATGRPCKWAKPVTN